MQRRRCQQTVDRRHIKTRGVILSVTGARRLVRVAFAAQAREGGVETIEVEIVLGRERRIGAHCDTRFCHTRFGQSPFQVRCPMFDVVRSLFDVRCSRLWRRHSMFECLGDGTRVDRVRCLWTSSVEELAHARDHLLRLERLHEHAVRFHLLGSRFVHRFERTSEQQHRNVREIGSTFHERCHFIAAALRHVHGLTG